jgi:broad specificity phosphatase PhoE
MTRLYWVRHGENRANLTKELSCRRVDYSLTEKGVLQAEQAAEHFAGLDISALYASPLKRAQETAQIIAARLRLPVTILEAFREVNVGLMEMEPPSAGLWARHDKILACWYAGEKAFRFPGGENYLELLARVQAGLGQVFTENPGESAIVVAHGGNILHILGDLCPGADVEAIHRSHFHNCAISELELTRRDGRVLGRLVSWGGTGHLHGPAADFIPGTPQPGELK